MHLHLEYDSGLDVIAAAMSTIPEGDDDTDEHRAHVSHDISSAVAHLLDIDAITPEGCPVRVTDVSMDVVVDVDDHVHEDGLGTTPAEYAEMESEARAVFDSVPFTDDEFALISDGATVAESAGPPPFELAPAALTDVPRFIADWGIVCGYLARACVFVMDGLFDDLLEVTEHPEDAESVTNLAGALPPQWVAEYTPHFFRRFIVTMSEVTGQVVAGWDGPRTIAQLLAISHLVDQVELLAALDDVELAEGMVDELRMRLVDDDLTEDVFESAHPDCDFDMWFVTFSHQATAPYATDWDDHHPSR